MSNLRRHFDLEKIPKYGIISQLFFQLIFQILDTFEIIILHFIALLIRGVIVHIRCDRIRVAFLFSSRCRNQLMNFISGFQFEFAKRFSRLEDVPIGLVFNHLTDIIMLITIITKIGGITFLKQQENKVSNNSSNWLFSNRLILHIKINYICAFVSQLQLTIKQAMLSLQKKYISELDKWCKDKGADPSAYFPTFCQNLESFLEVCISFDDRIVLAVHKMLKSFDYVEFTGHAEHKSPLKTKLKQVIRVLAEYEFMSIKNCQKLTLKMESNFLREKIVQFLKLADEARRKKNGALQEAQIVRIWKHTLQVNFLQIWAFLAKSQISDQIILELYDTSLPLIRSYSIQKIQEINDYRNKIMKNMRQKNQYSMILDIFRPCDDAQKNKKYSEAMDEFITRNSLFLNKDKYDLACQQIKNVVATIKNGMPNGNSLIFELYGSMRTGFAILHESDGDIELIPQGATKQMSREKRIEYLQKVYAALRMNSLGLLEFSSIEPVIFQKIRIPFIKVKFQDHFDFNKNTRHVLRSIDLIINTPNGVKNSKMLQLYSKSDYLIKFCNFVKLWAKRKTLINARMPTEGLSSYGIVLMALFYLIKTDQAPYIIGDSQKYRLSKNLLSDNQCSPLFDNFRGFLEFYKLNGIFFMENMVVCLKEKFVQTPYTYKYLVNMHDFIDGSNPGRINKKYRDKFFNILHKTYTQLINYEPITELLKYENQEH